MGRGRRRNRLRHVFLAVCAGLCLGGWTAEVRRDGAAPSGNPPSAAIVPPAATAATRSPAAPAAVGRDGLLPAGDASLTAPVATTPKRQVRRSNAAGQIIARKASISVDGQRTLFSLGLSRAARFSVASLVDPYRIILDLEGVEFQLTQDQASTAKGLVQGYRYGSIGPGRSRVVLDVPGPTLVEAKVAEGRGPEASRIDLWLTATDAVTFRTSLHDAPERAPTTAALPPPATSAPGPGGAGALSSAKKDGRPLIVLDPGHGGIDAGTVGSQSKAEKDVTLAFARLLRDRLAATRRYNVLLTREIDVFVSLEERVRFARESGCDLLISLHTDSVPPQYAHLNVRGATVYTNSDKANDQVARALAEKENLSDILAGVDVKPEEQSEVADILVDLLKRETTNRSRTFTSVVLDHMRGATTLSREPHRLAAFRVLRAPDVPSVLVELGYLSNKDDEKLLLSRAWQEKLAQSVANAVDAYFAKPVSRAPY